MREKIAEIFTIAEDNVPIEGCTVSKQTFESENASITHFSLGKDTDISPEHYPCPALLIGASNDTQILLRREKDEVFTLSRADCIVIEAGLNFGTKGGKHGAVYTQITLPEETQMQNIELNKIFALADLVPYAEGKIVNKYVVRNKNLKFVVMSFDDGCSLGQHSAPGEAMVFALEGKAEIFYEGKTYPIKAGENFVFEKNGKHDVKAVGKFKMALLLTLE